MTTEEYKQICEYFRDLVQGTEWEGHLYAVGGCCRDDMMHLPINDVDIAVDLPDGGVRFAKWLRAKRLTIGEPVVFQAFGTAKLRMKRFPHDEIELVQTRREKYTDRNSRNPETCFGTLQEDCERRDLTINSLFYDIQNRRTVDITGKGIHDMEHHIIRTPMDPDTTFDDDPVRILRTIRFACRYGWEIQPETYNALGRNIDRLEIIKPERMRGEFEKMLLGPDPVRAMEMMRETGALKYVYPELLELSGVPGDPEGNSVWEHSMKTLAQMPSDLAMRLGAMMHDIGKTVTEMPAGRNGINFPQHEERGPLLSRKMLGRLKTPHYISDEVSLYTRFHHALQPYGPKGEKLKVKKLQQLQRICRTPERFEKLMRFIDANCRAQADPARYGAQTAAARALSAKLQQEGSAMFVTEPDETVSEPKPRRHRGGRWRRKKSGKPDANAPKSSRGGRRRRRRRTEE